MSSNSRSGMGSSSTSEGSWGGRKKHRSNKLAVPVGTGSRRCEELRMKGNEVYRQVSVGGFGPCIMRMKLSRAEELYKGALNESSTADDRASCLKNLGALSWTRAKFEMEEVLVHEPLRPVCTVNLGSCKRNIVTTVDFYLKAVENGVSAHKAQDWLDHLRGVLVSMVDWAAEQSNALCLAKVDILKYLCDAFDYSSVGCSLKREVATIAHKQHAESIFKKGVSKLSVGEEDDPKDYKGCLCIMHDCCQPLWKAENHLQLIVGRAATKRKLLEEIEELKEDVQLYLCICESLQALAIGDDLLKKALLDDEDINIDLCWDAIDWYKKSSLLSRQKDLETEALVMSRIGKVYSEVFKDEARASQYHVQATALALSIISPRIIRSVWYMYSSKKTQEHQERVVARESAQHEQARQPILKKLEDKLKDLRKEATKSAQSFLSFVYTTHPPHDCKKRQPEVGTVERTKRALRTAIVHYHPQNNAKHGREWEVLCEEITKVLNNKYECFK